MPENAITRRNRRLIWMGSALLLGIICLTVYCTRRPGFDLSTPERALETFKRAMDGRRWSQAETCLTDRCREHYQKPVEDRRIFEFWSPHGYTVTQAHRLVPDWKVREIEVRGGKARARIATTVPLMGGEQAGFWLELVRCPDGLWRVDGPLENFDYWYDRLIPPEARGWGQRVERR